MQDHCFAILKAIYDSLRFFLSHIQLGKQAFDAFNYALLLRKWRKWNWHLPEIFSCNPNPRSPSGETER